MISHPQPLKKGDTVAIACPAKKLPAGINEGISLLESWDLNVILGDSVTASHHQFAGTDELRTKDFQRFLDDDTVKAIFAGRGGYGTIRIIDRLDFSKFRKNPKWIIGFSDITVLHSHIYANFQVPTIHGQMPVNVPDASGQSLQTLRKALFGEQINYTFNSYFPNKSGTGEGILVGGNLTLLMMMSGSVSEMNLENKILFLEDVGEYLYSIDRMMWNLKRAGKLHKLNGLIVGGFTESKDEPIPFGQTSEEIIWEHVKDYDFPVCFNFPAGHISDNQALIFGKTVNLSVNSQSVALQYID